MVSEESNWIVVGPSPLQDFRNNASFEHAVFDRRQTQNHAQFLRRFTGRSRLRQIVSNRYKWPSNVSVSAPTAY